MRRGLDLMGLKIEIPEGALYVECEAEPLLVIDRNFQVIYLNEKAREKYAYHGPLPVPCYRLTHELNHPCSQEGEECPLRKVLEQGKATVCIHRHKGEELLYEKILALPVRDSRGEVAGIVEILVDISSEVKAEVEARARAESLLEALEVPRVGAFILDSRFRVVWASRAIEEFFGLTRAEVLGEDMRGLIQEKIAPLMEKSEEFSQKILQAYQKHAYVENLVCHILPKERPERWVEHFSTPLRHGLYQGGRVEYYFDITPLKNLERKLLQAQKMETLGRLTAGLAHDFNNILMGIQGFITLAQMKLGERHPVNSYLRKAYKSSERAAEIVRKLLTFVKKYPQESYPIDLVRFFRESEELLRLTAGEGVRLKLEAPEEPLHVLASEDDLTQILLNLVTNAREAMPQGGELWIGLRKDGQRALLEIEDTGVGIPSENLPHIFDPFFTTKELGSGLGLSVVYGLVKALGGEIEVQSTPGKGTLFRIAFPLFQS
ncbi:PAS domain-containing protein [Thermosulfurimonas marina]|uniref:histidine kinase n=1 Tax=Thermosulfurimonas marina TaxID=2047767 RepID=A0A6H1WTR2_9BACT|nr:PAS domain-containing sensor histidine kinase [Thermosulfurimonas marina]QJA06506.1 PAS domain-containing protein [Thermosulfurimonas marina]